MHANTEQGMYAVEEEEEWALAHPECFVLAAKGPTRTSY
jgi:hypothetical protein